LQVNRSSIALVSVVILAGFAALSGKANSAREFRIDGWCLKHTGEDLEFYPDPNRPSGIPDFRIPFDLRLPDFSATADETGLVVTYTKRPTYSWKDASPDPLRMGCDRVPLGNGLSQLTGEGLPNCRASKANSYWFEPTEPFGLLKGVFVRCGRHPRYVNCEVTGLLPKDWEWEAQITLPKAHLDDWQNAARAARNYFNTYLSDCGVN
jgi:hypothetical protein